MPEWRGDGGRPRGFSNSSLIPDNKRHNGGFARGWGTSLPPLFAEQHQQLRIRSEDLAHGVLKPPSRFDALADVVDPLFGNAFDAVFPGRHEREEPDWVAFAGSAVTGGFAATAVSQ